MIDKIIITIVSLTVGYLIGWAVQGYVTYQRNLEKERKHKGDLIEDYYATKEKERKEYEGKMNAKPTGYFNLFKDKGGEWRFNILASNFKVIAVSEGYDSKRNAKLGIKSVLKSCSGFITFRERK